MKLIEDSGPDLKFRDLPIKVLRHRRLAEKFHIMHSLIDRVMRSMIPRGLVSKRPRQ
jgi:hypothetical protein